MALTPFTTGAGGTIVFSASYALDKTLLNAVQKRVVVLHGRMINGECVGSTAIACGWHSSTEGVLRVLCDNVVL